MRPPWLAPVLLLWVAAACDGDRSSKDGAGDGADGAPSADAGTGGAGGAEAGPATGGAGGSAGGSGGAAGNACFEGDTVREALRACESDRDCGMVVDVTCCGANRAQGVAVRFGCESLTHDCSAVAGCVKSSYAIADDGQTGALAARCRARRCESFVAPPAADDAGPDGAAPASDAAPDAP